MPRRTRTAPSKPLPHPRDVPTLTIPEAGKYLLGFSVTASYRAANEGRLPTIRVAEHRRVVPTAELWRLLGLDPDADGEDRKQLDTDDQAENPSPSAAQQSVVSRAS